MRFFVLFLLICSPLALAKNIYFGGKDIEAIKLGASVKELEKKFGAPKYSKDNYKAWITPKEEIEATFEKDRLTNLSIRFLKPTVAPFSANTSFIFHKIKPSGDADSEEALLSQPKEGKRWRISHDGKLKELHLSKPWEDSTTQQPWEKIRGKK